MVWKSQEVLFDSIAEMKDLQNLDINFCMSLFFLQQENNLEKLFQFKNKLKSVSLNIGYTIENGNIFEDVLDVLANNCPELEKISLKVGL